MKRVFLIVLDSCGAGQMPDAALFGDRDCNTIKRISTSDRFICKNMKKLGLGSIDGLDFIGKTKNHTAAAARMTEHSMGKDTTIGHWEIAGVVSPAPLPTYPDGFPDDVISEFSRLTGRKVICNKPYSGTEVIKDYGEEHIKTGALIVYTSADSVFQIAAHEDIVPLEQLYEYCRTARRLLSGKHAVGRVIARPFVGTCRDDFSRTANRHDFSLEPPKDTMLDAISASGKTVYAIGKIFDIFVGRGITEHVFTHSNAEGMRHALNALDKDFEGLCFVNLVDFDMLYGHRQDIDGYAAAFSEFDAFLPSFIKKMRDDDILMITADHGCDPGDKSTDHTREYTPLLVYGKHIQPVELGTRSTFADIAATVTDYLGVDFDCDGVSMLEDITINKKALFQGALDAMKMSYSPYSGCKVGAALQAKSGKIYLGCNIENAAYGPTVCAERVAFFKAISEGEKEFTALFVAGGKDSVISGSYPPCGVCRQVMSEFCGADFPIFVITGENSAERYTLGQLLPYAFTPDNLVEGQ